MVSVVISSWNKRVLTQQCIESVLLNKSVGEVIVVDNGSIDSSQELILSYKDDRVIPLINDGNVGFSMAMNQGLMRASCEYVLFSQNDVFVEQHSVDNTVKTFNLLENCGCLGVGGGFIDGHKLVEITELNGDEMIGYDKAKNFYPIEVDFVAGFYMFCDRKFLINNGIKFDTQYDPYWEDVDFCNQIVDHGKKLYMVSKSLIPYMHIRSASITPSFGEQEREKRRENSYNYYIKKWSARYSGLLERYHM